MNRNRKLAAFNWYVLLACALVFIAGGTLSGIAAIILSGHILLWAVSMFLCVGLYFVAFQSLRMMERC